MRDQWEKSGTGDCQQAGKWQCIDLWREDIRISIDERLHELFSNKSKGEPYGSELENRRSGAGAGVF